MTSLSPAQFGPDQPLPGTEHISPAEPHEQTESQFLNRPDVFWHGRMENSARPLSQGPKPRSAELHAGTEAAAVQRLSELGPRWSDHMEPRFYAGRVDPAKMNNTPDKPMSDMGEDWAPEDRNHYYRNEYEDPGSLSVNLSVKSNNFKSWRGAVSNAIRAGKPVPHHVRGVFADSGGEQGPRTYTHSNYREPLPGAYASTDNVVDGLSWTGLAGNPNDKFGDNAKAVAESVKALEAHQKMAPLTKVLEEHQKSNEPPF